MEPTTYLGASSHHVHCENYILKEGEPIKLFGDSEIYPGAEWLDMKNCSGVIDSSTFSLLPNMDYINMDGCNIEDCFPKAFSPLEKLRALDIRNSKFPIKNEIFEDSKNISSLSLSNMKIPTSNIFGHLNNLESLSFSECVFEQLNKDIFSGMNNLKYLSISDSEIGNISTDCFDDMLNLEGLSIRDNVIGNVDCSSILKLTNLNRFSFHHNTTSSDIDYDAFHQLTSLESILFETSVYKSLNFDDFPNLKTVEIGYFDEEKMPDEDEVIEKLKLKNITFQYVFCGKVEYDMDDMQVCC
nr:leucine-rich repeat-containing protein 70-like [Leptinotarsa decemlineata]